MYRPIGLYVKYRLFLSDFMKLEFSWADFRKYSNLKFHENPPSGSRAVPCGRTDKTDTTKLIVPFRNFAEAPKNTLHGNV